MKVRMIKAQPPKVLQISLAPGTLFHSPGQDKPTDLSQVYMKTQHGAVSLDFGRSSMEVTEQSYFTDEEHGEDECIVLGRLEVKL